eukprot:12752216-Alexandrium_andersonii.AAC.1
MEPPARNTGPSALRLRLCLRLPLRLGLRLCRLDQGAGAQVVSLERLGERIAGMMKALLFSWSHRARTLTHPRPRHALANPAFYTKRCTQTHAGNPLHCQSHFPVQC